MYEGSVGRQLTYFTEYQLRFTVMRILKRVLFMYICVLYVPYFSNCYSLKVLDI
jgi:hypothetical protein